MQEPLAIDAGTFKLLALIGAAIFGALFGGVMQLIVQWRKHKCERRNMASAFVGEIGSINEMVRERRYLEILDHYIRPVAKVAS